jgi:hypothetical protein
MPRISDNERALVLAVPMFGSHGRVQLCEKGGGVTEGRGSSEGSARVRAGRGVGGSVNWLYLCALPCRSWICKGLESERGKKSPP